MQIDSELTENNGKKLLTEERNCLKTVFFFLCYFI